MAKSVLVLLAEGFEEIEAVTAIDVLRRAGAEVVAAGLTEGPIAASRGVRILPDAPLDDVLDRDFDLVVLPGGMPGAANLRDDPRVARLVANQISKPDRVLGAICAAPAVVLSSLGLLRGRRATGHPNFAEKIRDTERADGRVVVDGNLVTSKGPGTALEFALKLVEVLFGPEKARDVNAPMYARVEAGD